jgi:hypothetical protein
MAVCILCIWSADRSHPDHPEEGERAYSTFNSKESRIMATDAYAERRPMQETEEAIDRVMNKGLRVELGFYDVVGGS